ncbi:MAG: outer membrane beta-barrel protein [Nitrosomonadaceae bacterium]
MLKLNFKFFLVALALGSCTSMFTFGVAADDGDRGTFTPRKKPAKLDYTAWKGDERFYVVTALNNNSQVLDFASGTSAEGNSRGFQLGLGYSFNENFAVELSLNEHGEITERSDDGASKVDFATDSIDMAMVGKMPVMPNWVVYGKVGLSSWRSQLDLAGIPTTSRNFIRSSDSGVDLFVGAGMNYGLTRYVDIFTEVDLRTFEPVFDNATYDAHVATWMMGFKFYFGKAKSDQYRGHIR